MKIKRILLIASIFLFVLSPSYSQDKRTIETKVADLLAQLPVNDNQSADKLMNDMLLLGEDGLKLICSRIIPSGTGDDTSVRFAVESLSRYLSTGNMEKEQSLWENICISFAIASRNAEVKDFFMKQLQLMGGKATIDALKGYLADKEMCNPALAAILSAGGKDAEQVLAEALRNRELPCAAAVMNALASMNSQIAVNEYISWTSDPDIDTKASAYNALACSSSKLAYPVLLNAAKEAGYRWEPTGATASLLKYARNTGESGDLKTLDKICKLLISKCTDAGNIQNKTAALKLYVDFHGLAAEKQIFKAAAHPDKSYRSAAIYSSINIPGNEIVRKWISYFPKATESAKPEIIAMLARRGSEEAIPLIASSLESQNVSVRNEAAAALSAVLGNKAAQDLIEYIRRNPDPADQEAGRKALMTVAGNNEIALLRPLLISGPDAARVSAIELMAWNRNPEYFKDVIPFTASENENVKAAAYKALSNLVSSSDQPELIKLISATEKVQYVEDVQDALRSAALKIENSERRSDEILKAVRNGISPVKLIPVLAATGGKEALAVVLGEFEKGNPEMRDVCFKTLTSWRDYDASSALFEIVSSRNKTYEAPAFQGYLKQISQASLPAEQKLLYYKKIMPYALDSDRKNQVIAETGKLKIYQALFFVGDYLDDPSTSAAAARSAMLIAMPSTDSGVGMHGTIVREILVKAAAGLRGSESDYEKEMINKYLSAMPQDEGFMPMFNGKDLTGWQGLVENPIARGKMRKAVLARKQAEADVKIPASWSVRDGCIWFNGTGDNLCSVKEYGDFEMLVDWRITKNGDSGIYLRGTPQVQIWDPSRKDVGASVGSGGLYNNQVNPSKPLVVADNPVGEWNTFRIIMIGEKVSVWLNGKLVVDDVVMENYWDRNIPIFPKGPIELQAHGTDLAFRDIYVREISEKDYNLTPEEISEGFVSIFNGRNLDNWIGNKESYVAEDGMIVIRPESGSGGNLYTEKEYSDFILRFEFLLTPAANNGLGIRAPLQGDAAYVGMELQIIDNTAPVYANLKPYQYHGSVYGVIPARRGFQNPVGEWNYQEVYVKGTRIKITLNGTVILDGDIAGPRDNGTMDQLDHPGLKNETGHIGFLGHGSVVKFRNIRIKDLSNE